MLGDLFHPLWAPQMWLQAPCMHALWPLVGQPLIYIVINLQGGFFGRVDEARPGVSAGPDSIHRQGLLHVPTALPAL